MQGLGYKPSGAEAGDLLKQMQDVARDANGKNLYAKIKDLGDGATIKLFTRSAVSDLLMKVFSPEKRTQQKLAAADAIKSALKFRFPDEVASQITDQLGLHGGKGIRLSNVWGKRALFDYLKDRFPSASLETFPLKEKLQFSQWHIAASSGLRHFVNLGGEDLTKIMALKDLISPTTLMAFQSFVEHSIKPSHEKPANAHINKNEVLNFLSGWCDMTASDKSELLRKLSVDGRTALEAVDVLVQKMIAAQKLPLSFPEGVSLPENLIRQLEPGAIVKSFWSSVSVNGKTFPSRGKELGRGAEGVVKKLTNASKESVVVKSADPDAVKRQGLLHEAGVHQIASNTGHKNLLKMFGCTRDAQDNVSIYMEYAPHGSIDDYLKKFGAENHSKLDEDMRGKLQQASRYIFRSVLQGLAALHGAGVIHRDLKPGNILIGEDGTPKIADFGKAVVFTESISKGLPVDSPDWLAPELFAPNTSQCVEASPASDVWAAAIVMYQLATDGMHPFEFTEFNTDNFKMLETFGKDRNMTDFDKRFATLKLDRLADKDLAVQLCAMLHPDASQRPSAREVLSWLNRQGQSDDAALGKLLVNMSKTP